MEENKSDVFLAFSGNWQQCSPDGWLEDKLKLFFIC
jgi:hypothetical protein